MTEGMEWKMRKEWRPFAAPAVCVAGSLLLYVLLTVLAPRQGPVSESGEIVRGGYGSGEKEYQLLVEGLRDKAVPVTVKVHPREYTRAEASIVFEQIMDGMEEQIRGENLSLYEVNQNLKLPSRLPTYGVRLKWYSSDPSLLDASGKLLREVDAPEDVLLSVQLSADVLPELSEDGKADEDDTIRYHQDYEIPVRVIPAERAAEEMLLADYESRIAQADVAQQGKEVLTLPAEYEGHRLTYRTKERDGYESILLVGLMAAVLLWARDQSSKKEKEKRRERELLLDYADLLSKLVVLTGAGLTIRNAWEKIVHDYESAKMAGKQKKRAAYEEMRLTCEQMRNGVSESEAYREFGKRCGLQQYLKLSGLLEQNRRTGTKNLRDIFQAEMTDALEQRKNLALRLGEEAGTRLLIPLFLMLGIVMVMIMVPAMMSMG
jgi:hypothetical protein